MVTIGVDGGLTGALAMVDGARAVVLDLPVVEDRLGKRINVRQLSAELSAARQQFAVDGAPALFGTAYIEQLATGGFSRKSSAVTIGQQHVTHGEIRTVLCLRGLDVDVIPPQRWKKFYGIRNVDGEKNTNRSLEIARDLFPDLAQTHLRRVMDHNRAEALLIAHFARKALA